MKKQLITIALMTILLVTVAGCTTPGSVGEITTATPNPDAGAPAANGQINVPAISIQVNAPSPNPLINTPDANGQVAGILLGIWHGIISPVTLVMSFIDPNAQMYEVHNDGSQYNFGFLVGVAIMFLILGVLIGTSRR